MKRFSGRLLYFQMIKANPLGAFEILLVDDSPADAKIFQEALVELSARARVYWVSSGEEALDFLSRRGRFAGMGAAKLVVLDVNMPGINGIETLRRIKINPDLSRIPVVLLSSGSSPEEIDLAYSLGANAYFTKPLSLESYVQKIKIIVQHWLDSVELPSPLSSHSDRDAASAYESTDEYAS